MIVSSRLLRDLQRQLKALEADLRTQSDDPDVEWSRTLKAEHAAATRRGRTSFTWSVWRDGEIAQAAVAWLVATTFVRFCEDNHLLDGARRPDGPDAPVPWIAGPVGAEHGDRFARAVEHQTAYFGARPTANDRDWIRESLAVLASLPAGRGLVDPSHNPIWRADISAEAARSLLSFWRAVDDDGALVHDFTDANLDTRFLGDIYQDLSEYAKKTYALLQTPVFVEEFILEQTLAPAINEFGLPGLKIIDPACGSGHFLLGAFARLNSAWQTHAPALDARQRVRKALGSIHGVDLNPFAVAIARFRLTVAALRASGERSLVDAPAFGYHLAIGDSLLGEQGTTDTSALFEDDDESGDETFAYAAEDLGDYAGLLTAGTYHAVVGNPPYITVKDPTISAAYRKAYPTTCHRQYALSVPFIDLFFRLARREGPDGGAGYVGQITSNSFMKREFGTKLIENLLSGRDLSNPVDLTSVIDTSGAYIPGHGTPTVILVGRRRRPTSPTVHAALGIRGEPGQPADPAKGLVWTEITEHIADATFNGSYVTITDLDRSVLATHPWSLSGGGASNLLECLNNSARQLESLQIEIGRTTHTGLDEAFYRDATYGQRKNITEIVPVVLGEQVRDFVISSNTTTLLPYDSQGAPITPSARFIADLWTSRTLLERRVDFGHTPEERGLRWFDHSMFFAARFSVSLSIAFPFVSTHNHFVLDRGGKVFKQTAPVIKLPASASEDDHLSLLAILNTSTACFWLKQVSHDKGNGGIGGGIADQEWERFFEFTGTKLQQFPLPAHLPTDRGRILDGLAQVLAELSPATTLAGLAGPNPDDADAAEGRRPVAGSAGKGATKEPLGTTGLRLSAALAGAHEAWDHIRTRMIFEQEELDWDAYLLHNLTDHDLTYTGPQTTLALGERAFELTLACKLATGEEESAWFTRHNSTPLTEIPTSWPADYQSIVQRRLDEIERNPFITLLERPENKRRWATTPWETQERDALRTAILDRLEAADLWHDAHGAVTRSVAELADLVRSDEALRALLETLQGSSDVDVVPVLTSLIADEAVPYLAALRYKPSGVEKFREWQHVWDLQREEDRIDAGGVGKKPAIPVPPKYGPPDFLKTSYWRARGKLDVPKERFISYPGTARTGDPSPVLGWAGWDHAEQGIALARLLASQEALGADATAAEPLLAGLVELEPWLHQWHAEIDRAFGTSPASTVSGLLNQKLAEYGRTRDDVTRWAPAAATRGRKAKVSSGNAAIGEGE